MFQATSFNVYNVISENEKLRKKMKFNKDLINSNEDINLLDMWLRSQNESSKLRLEFYGRVSYPNQIAQLYTHLKLDEMPTSKLTGYSFKIYTHVTSSWSDFLPFFSAKIEIS